MCLYKSLTEHARLESLKALDTIGNYSKLSVKIKNYLVTKNGELLKV